MSIRPAYTREGSVSSLPQHDAGTVPYASSDPDEKANDSFDEKAGHHVAASIASVASENMLANGKERPIETANDIATRCVSLDDDPTLVVHTLRMWTIGTSILRKLITRHFR